MKKKNSSDLRRLVDNPQTFMRVKDVHERMHAKNLDKKLGFKVSRIELKLLQKYRAYDRASDDSSKKGHYEGAQTWIGLHPQALQTSYNEIFDALYVLRDMKINRVLDIGCGYGRVGLVMNSLFPHAEFIGLEILKQRQLEGNRVFDRLNLSNCKIQNINVLQRDFRLPRADVYFIYDFSEVNDVDFILGELSQRLKNDNFFLITKGKRIDYLISKKYPQFWKTNGFLSSGELKIYSSRINLGQNN